MGSFGGLQRRFYWPGAINVATNWNNIDNFWQGVGYFGVGATAGAIGALTGGAALAMTGGLGGSCRWSDSWFCRRNNIWVYTWWR